MPSRYAAVKVGAMTKADRNSARLTITAFGGAVWVPMAERKSDSTTTMRVNEVTITRTEGASASTVTSATSWSARSVTPPPLAEIERQGLGFGCRRQRDGEERNR